MKPYALLLIPFLSGCNGLEILSGEPSPSKAHFERMALLTTPENEAEIEAVETVECVEVFRVTRCNSSNNPIPWSM